jgi:predicted metal-dependent peptidase
VRPRRLGKRGLILIEKSNDSLSRCFFIDFYLKPFIIAIMSFNASPEIRKFRAGLEELLWLIPMLGNFARAMGEPVFDPTQKTAYVTFDEDKCRVRFCFNPEFLMELDDVTLAAVIAHEAHHVILRHLNEMQDRAIFPKQDLLVKAQEVVINDTIEGTYQLQLPDFVMRGMDIVGKDCSPYTSKQVYDMLDQKQEEEEKSEDQPGNGSGAPGEPSDGASGEDATPGSGDASSAGTDESDGSKATPGNPSPGDTTSDDPGHHGCGGVQVPEGMEDAFNQAINDAIQEVAQETGKTVEEVIDTLTQSVGGFSLSGATGMTEGSLSQERMNWRHLLAKINPKVLDSGAKRRKSKNNWTKPNRRMASVYPRVILPVSERIEPKKDDKGDTLPTLVIALDLSGSIPRTLVKTLQGMLNDIPKDLIRSFPCTWSTSLVVYNEKTKGVCKSYGTQINLVSRYVDKVKAETGTDPYVLVITDGDFHNSYTRPGQDWYFMSVDDRSMPRCRNHARGDDHLFNIRDFRIA